MGRGSFGSNMLIASTWHHREEMKRIGRGNADRRWDVLPQQPALAYDIAQNRLIVSAAVLQPPVLDLTADAATQYGAFGALVGRELSHAVDGKGRLVDARTEVRDWWTPAESGAWTALGNRIAAQYAAYSLPVVGTSVNGNQVRDVAIADQAGVELAWLALNAAQPAASKEARQAFFTGWARLWPQQLTREAATQRAPAASTRPVSGARTDRCPTWRDSARPLAVGQARPCRSRPTSAPCSGPPQWRFRLPPANDGLMRRPCANLRTTPRARGYSLQRRLPDDFELAHAAPLAAERRLPAPVTDQQPAEQHAAQMREMRHARLPAVQAKQQFGHGIQDDERTGLHSEWAGTTASRAGSGT
jgi:hypothetical protein